MSPSLRNPFLLRGVGVAALTLVFSGALYSQAITIDKAGNIKNGSGHSEAPVDRRFAPIEPTHVNLGKSSLDAKTRMELIRVLESEQGFAMRPFPRGRKGLVLVANGPVQPAGEAWVGMVTENGLSVKPGDPVVLTDVKVEHNKIVFQINGGPDVKHRFLRHIQIGAGPMMNPVVQDNGEEPTGSRLTLVFSKGIPELTGSEVKALLAPLISFDVKSPVQAFTDTLPPVLKEAILNHHVMVGMSTDMVLFALGQPESKTREMDGQMPFEEWIYGKPPKPVEFVRINGNRVIRVEIANVGETPKVYDKDEVSALMRTDGTPAVPSGVRTASMGDSTYNTDTQAAPAPPSLRKPGEKLPDGSLIPADQREGPVRFPKPNLADEPPVAHKPQAGQQTGPANTPASQPSAPQPAATGSAPQP